MGMMKRTRVTRTEPVLARATEVFGNREAARVWLRTPAVALHYQRPAELLSTPAGAESVKRLLIQMEHCVYV